MTNPKGNEYGQLPLYDVGDTVKVWPIYKNPIGTIKQIISADTFPIKYLVEYQYFKGGWYTETFDEGDLTLCERRSQWGCNCKTNSDVHATWCNRYNSKRW